MNTIKIISGVAVGALFMAVALAITSLFIKSDESTPLGTANNFWLFGMIACAVYGLIAGGIEGAIISSFDQVFFLNILIGFSLNLFFGIVLLLLTGGGWTDAMTNTYYASVIIGTINGAVVSLVNIWQPSLK